MEKDTLQYENFPIDQFSWMSFFFFLLSASVDYILCVGFPHYIHFVWSTKRKFFSEISINEFHSENIDIKDMTLLIKGLSEKGKWLSMFYKMFYFNWKTSRSFSLHSGYQIQKQWIRYTCLSSKSKRLGGRQMSVC